MTAAHDLDAGAYRGTYKLIAGASILDFANLVSYRGTDREHDWLDPVTNLAVWCQGAGMPSPGADEVAGLRAFREVVARVFLAVADGDTPDAGDVDRIGRLAGEAWARRRLRFPTGAANATWIDPTPSLIGDLADDAATLLTSSDALDRVKACDDCRWLFLDTSRNRSRRWCDPADCGNRARQRRHYRLRRGR